jgi:hypothetical protein
MRTHLGAWHERRAEAGTERRLRLADADLGAGELGRIAADEVVCAWSWVSRAIGGSTPNASAVRRMTVRGWPVIPVGSTLPMKWSG